METAGANEASCSSSSLPPSIAKPLKYDVFLSFSGVDTRNNFTSHLFISLKQHGFHTFMDDKGLKQGEYIDHELLKAIEESRISLVILSKNYATSTWCLDELVKIMECKEKQHQIVFPIFHGVEPKHVRKQKGSFAEAFAKHAENFGAGPGSKVEKWREALAQVGKLTGWDLPKVDNGNEAMLIQKIVKEVGKRLNIAHLKVPDHTVGLESRLEKLNALLSMELSTVCIVGIWGFGGIGKTTIAMAQYNRIQHMFEGSSFLENVRETWKQRNGPVDLQEQLLLNICGHGTHKQRSWQEGINVIERRAFCRKVLIVLDDVDDYQQFKVLAIDRHSFVPGSRIIITTRDVALLKRLGVDEIYEPKELNWIDSIKLLSWHAFKDDHPRYEYLGLSSQVVCYVGGLPLALEILGSCLHDKSTTEWKSAILKLENIPNDQIQEKLKISFDSLDKGEKDLFLDIACFFVGTDRDFTVKMLEGCQKHAVIGIRNLVDRGLVKDDYGIIVMHDLLRDMGREIARGQGQEWKDPGKWSRLWNHGDALEVLKHATGTEAVEGLVLNFHELNEVQVNSKAFEKMNRLWLLHLNYVHLREGYEHISRRLMWLCWNGFPLNCLPSNLHMENLVTLDLRYSSLKKAWKGTKIMVKLKFLYLSHCYELVETPNFSGLNNLEELLLNDCKSLVKVDKSILCLDNLVVLDMKNCTKLWQFSYDILMLKSLKSVDLSGCSKLGCSIFGNFPRFEEPLPWLLKLIEFELKLLFFFEDQLKSPPEFRLWMPTSLRNLDLGENNLDTLPDSIYDPTRLKKSMMEYNSPSPSCLTNEVRILTLLQTSDLTSLKMMMECNDLSLLPIEVGNSISWQTLDLSGIKLRALPDRVCDLTSLNELKMRGCNLSCLPNEVGKLISLKTLSISGSDLDTLPDSFCGLTRLTNLTMVSCNLTRLPNKVGDLKSLETLQLGRNKLHTLPDSFWDLTGLKFLDLKHNLLQLPSEIGRLTSLQFLNLGYNNLPTLPDSICNLACLEGLFLHNCDLYQLPDRIGMLSSLSYLGLPGNHFRSLPESISDLACTRELNVGECRSLQSLPQLPINLRCLNAVNCRALESIPTEFNWLAGLCMSLEGCNMLAKNNFANNLMERIGQSLSGLSPHSDDITIHLPGDKVPKWFKHQYTGSRLSIVVPESPESSKKRMQGFFLCIVFTYKSGPRFPGLSIFFNKPTRNHLNLKVRTRLPGEYQICTVSQICMLYVRSDLRATTYAGTFGDYTPILWAHNPDHRGICCGDELEIEISSIEALTVKKCGINFIYKDDKDDAEDDEDDDEDRGRYREIPRDANKEKGKEKLQ